MRFVIALTAMFLLAGCAGYQFGDASTALLDRQRAYCAETDPGARAVALAMIRAEVPGYPASGLCSDAEQALAEEIAERAGDGEAIDLEQARKDQERFQE